MAPLSAAAALPQPLPAQPALLFVLCKTKYLYTSLCWAADRETWTGWLLDAEIVYLSTLVR